MDTVVLRSRARTALIAVVLGATAGLASAAYLGLVQLLERLVWDHGEPRLGLPAAVAIPVTTVAGGVVVGMVRRRHDADSPHDLGDVLNGLDVVIEDPEPTGPPKVSWLVRSALLGVVSLGFGASLGPEAPLIALAAGLGQRMARLLTLTTTEGAYLSASGAVSGLFGGPLGAAALPVDGSHGRTGRALLPYALLAALAGFVTMVAALPGEAGERFVLPVHEIVEGRAALGSLGWATVVAVPATTAGLAIIGLSRWLRSTLTGVVPSAVVRAALGGLVLGLCGAASHLVIFSGHHQGQDLIDLAPAGWTAAGIAGLKVAATVACLSTGWFGGQIFPGIFTGMAVGLAVAAWCPAAPAAVLVAAGAGATCVAMLRKPLAAVLILLLFFPASSLLALTTGAALAAAIVHLLGERAPIPEH
ncbi:MAG: chloride channel protein [Desertimonas sp.]